MKVTCFRGWLACVVFALAPHAWGLAWGQASSAEQAAAVLARDVSALPRCEPGHWLDWQPDDPIAAPLIPLLRGGMGAYFNGDYAGALAAYYRLLELEPDFPPALYQTGTTHFRLRRYGDSIEFYTRFVEVVPGEVGATQALGHSYYSLGRYEEAREHYLRVLAANPESVEARRGLALSSFRLGEPERALEQLAEVLSRRPEHADAHTWRARILFELDHPEEALEAALRARDLSPYTPRVWFLLSGIYGDLERPEEAAEARARFAELDTLDQGIRALEGLLLYAPGDLSTRARLIELHRSAGNLAGVKRVLADLLRLVPADLNARILALDTLQAMGDVEGAAQAAADLATFCGEDHLAWRRLQHYYASTGDRMNEMQAGERHLRMRDAQQEREAQEDS